MAWPVVAAAVVSTLYSMSSSRKAAGAAKEAGKDAAKFTMAETTETLRRKALADAQVAGEGVATVSASGLRQSGSPMDYLNFLEAERQKESAWILQAGQLKAMAERKGGMVTASSYTAQGNLYALQGVQSLVQAWDRGADKPK